MISRGALADELTRRKVNDWVVIEREQELATASEMRGVQRTDRRTRWTVVAHHDVAHGRGTARVDVSALDGSASDVIDQALSLAEAAIGPAWRSASPSAPAQVAVFDHDLDQPSLIDATAVALRRLKRPDGATVVASIDVLREHVTVQAHSGFHTSWPATEIRASALIAIGDHSVEVSREARRLVDLGFDAELAGAATDLRALATAGAPVAGRCAVILATEALLHGGGLGAWSVFADQARSEVERQGLTRYRLGTPIAPGADQSAEPLTITSDGALEWGTRSAPVGDEGDAVRRFPIIEGGVATGFGLSTREAARRHVDPNGGVRNLVVARGTWAEALPNRRTVEVRRLRSFAVDPYTGDASLEIALAIDHDGGTQRPFSGGTVRLDLVTALARARRSATVIRRGAYLGPASVLLDDVELIL